MHRRSARLDCSRHAVARIEQRPVKRLPIERDQNAPLGHAFLQRLQQRMLLVEIAHEELLDLQTTRFPPGNAHKKRIHPGAARKAGGFRIEKKPLARIACEPRITFRIGTPRKQQPKHALRARIVFAEARLRVGNHLANQKVFAINGCA